MKDNAVFKIGVLIEHRNQLVLIKEKKKRDGKYYWNFVKGTFEVEKDKDPFATAHREAKEEANAKIRIKYLLNVLYLKKHEIAYIQFNFIAELVGKSFGLSKKADQKKFREDEAEDIIDIRLFSKKELIAMKRSEFIGERTYQSIHDWIKGKKHPLDVLKILSKF
jgi:ADP-ribose pyrophosphatase YjhB (NUDIX family)